MLKIFNKIYDWLTLRSHKHYPCEFKPITSIYTRDPSGDIVKHTRYYKCRICGKIVSKDIPMDKKQLYLVQYVFPDIVNNREDKKVRSTLLVSKTKNEVLVRLINHIKETMPNLTPTEETEIMDSIQIIEVDIVDDYKINIGERRN